MNPAAKSALRYGFFPAVMVLAVAAHLHFQTRLTQQELPILPLLICTATMPLMIAGEYFLPYRREWLRSQGDLLSDFLNTNLLLVAFTILSELVVMSLVLALALRLPVGPGFPLWPSRAPILLQLLLAVLTTEFCFYWSHRMFHRIPALWRLHSIHHGAGRLYWLNSGRFHPVEVLINTCFFVAPLYFLGAPPQVQALFFTYQGVHGFLEHANMDYDIGWLNWIFNSSQLHRWHHSRIESESNRNFAKTLILWDVVFGTRLLPRGREVEHIGVESEIPIPNLLHQQLVFPFVSGRAKPVIGDNLT